MGIKVLSLFDGISTGRLALDLLNIDVDKYTAYEIDEDAISVSKDNYKDIKHMGDVTTATGENHKDVDLLIGGSPCQDLSGAMANRKGLEGEKSRLFFEYVRVLEEVKPKFFLFENVGGASKEDRDIISSLLGVEPIRINSKDFSPALRNRLYWTNIPQEGTTTTKAPNLQDILVYGYTDRPKARALLASDSRPLATPIKMMHRYINTGFTTLIFKDEVHFDTCKRHFQYNFGGLSASDIESRVIEEDIDVSFYDGVRYMNQTELERCMTVPDGYTKVLTRNKAANGLGNGWTATVIVHLLKGLPYAS